MFQNIQGTSRLEGSVTQFCKSFWSIKKLRFSLAMFQLWPFDNFQCILICYCPFGSGTHTSINATESEKAKTFRTARFFTQKNSGWSAKTFWVAMLPRYHGFSDSAWCNYSSTKSRSCQKCVDVRQRCKMQNVQLTSCNATLELGQ